VRFEIEGDLLFFAFIGQDGTDEQHKTVGWNSIVQLQTLLGRGDGSQYGETIHSRLDVGSGTVFLCQHGLSPGDLVLQDDPGQHAPDRHARDGAPWVV
jgi:hypothetical protein